MNPFDFNGTELRTVELDGQLWFHAPTPAAALASLTFPTLSVRSRMMRDAVKLLRVIAVRKLDPTERATLNRIEVGLQPGALINAVSESGLYKLIMRSDKPEALAFQNWVTREVLPAIRQTGGIP